MSEKYAGSDWIKSNFKVELSSLGEAVADLLGDLFYGIYHLDSTALKKVDWANDHHIIFILGWKSLATTDFDELTRLVILCHDRCIRCEISPRAFHYLELIFHQRQREGNGWLTFPISLGAAQSHTAPLTKPLT